MSGNAFHVFSIVEGDGEVSAVPKLLCKVWDKCGQQRMGIIPRPPYRVHQGEFIERVAIRRKYLNFARDVISGKPGCVLILMDAEEDCCQNKLKKEMKGVCSDIAEILKGIPHLFVLAEKGYESWIVAGMGGEWKCSGSPKEWLKNHPEKSGLSGTYSETVDQRNVTASPNFDIHRAKEKNKSFRRFVERMLELPTKVSGGGK